MGITRAHGDSASWLSLMGRHLAIDHQNQHVVSLGQSPYWMVKAAELASQNRGDKTRYSYMPFSGGLLGLTNRSDDRGCEQRSYEWTVPAQGMPDTTGIYAHMQSIGIDKASIINNFTHGRKTVLVDYTESGKGMASFLSLLFQHAHNAAEAKQLQNALEVHLYEQGGDAKRISMRIPGVPYEISCRLEHFTGDVSVIKGDGVRSVPAYYPKQWADPPPPMIRNADVEHFEQSLIVAVRNRTPVIRSRGDDYDGDGGGPRRSSRRNLR